MSDRINKTDDIDLPELFKVLDRDLDGKISASELNYLMANLGTSLKQKDLAQLREIGQKGYEAFPQLLLVMARKLRDLEAEKELVDFCQVFADSDNGFISVADMKADLKDLKNKLSI